MPSQINFYISPDEEKQFHDFIMSRGEIVLFTHYKKGKQTSSQFSYPTYRTGQKEFAYTFGTKKLAN